MPSQDLCHLGPDACPFEAGNKKMPHAMKIGKEPIVVAVAQKVALRLLCLFLLVLFVFELFVPGCHQIPFDHPVRFAVPTAERIFSVLTSTSAGHVVCSATSSFRSLMMKEYGGKLPITKQTPPVLKDQEAGGTQGKYNLTLPPSKPCPTLATFGTNRRWSSL
jgi:hypothetical protein